MTERKPRVVLIDSLSNFTSSSYPDALDDDLFIDKTHRRHFARTLKETPADDMFCDSVYIDLYYTTSIRDPFDYYSNLLEHRGAIDRIDVDPSNLSVWRRYQWINAFWHLFSVHYRDGEEYSYSVVFDRTYQIAHLVIVECFEKTLADVQRKFADFQAVICDIFVSWSVAEARRLSDKETVGMTIDRIDKEADRLRKRDKRAHRVFWVNRENRTLVLSVDSRYLADIEPLLRLLPGTKERLPLQTYIVKSERDKTTGCYLGTRHFMPGVSQWLTYHRIILDLSIALAVLGLPPYVLLEILDWLPYFLHWRHSRKINLIVAIRRSIEAIRTARQLRWAGRLQSNRARPNE